MKVFVDTSAILPFLNETDSDHVAARQIWQQLAQENALPVSSNYVLLESFTLIQSRLGMKAVQIFHERVVPLLTVEWITKPLHQAGLTAFLSANHRKLSLVDCTSFETMRQLDIYTAFAFDQHFMEQGFTCLT